MDYEPITCDMIEHLCLVEFIDQNVYHMIFRRHFYFIVVVNVCIHVLGGGGCWVLHVICSN